MPADIDLSFLDPVLQKYEGRKGALIPMLQDIQEVYSYLPEEALARLSREAGIPMSRIYGVATFYAQFYLVPRGRNTIRICRGTACHVRGATRILEAVERELGITDGETTPDMGYSLETVACIGACALAPTMVVNQNTYGKLTPNKASEIVGHTDKKEREIE
ncbi:NADH-quinone oxidoreductase subunit NuoE [Chloroflexota bacterium]